MISLRDLRRLLWMMWLLTARTPGGLPALRRRIVVERDPSWELPGYSLPCDLDRPRD